MITSFYLPLAIASFLRQHQEAFDYFLFIGKIVRNFVIIRNNSYGTLFFHIREENQEKKSPLNLTI